MTNRLNINDKEYSKLFDNDDIGEVLGRIVGVEERDRARLSRAVFWFFLIKMWMMRVVLLLLLFRK